MTNAFAYPAYPHERQHHPVGYKNYESFRPWLRDEFSFRCVYCLTRETWSRLTGNFEIDHFRPILDKPELSGEYSNLLYACATCNSVKGDQLIPNPLLVLVGTAVTVSEDGTILAKTDEAKELIELLELDDDKTTEFREVWQQIVQLSHVRNKPLFRKLMSFPEDLPDLSRLKPPGGNHKPEGIHKSHFHRKSRGELPEIY